MNKEVAEARQLLERIDGAEKHVTWKSTFYRCTDGTEIKLEQIETAQRLLAINPNGAGRKPKYDWALIDTLIADGYHEHGITNPKKLCGYVADEYKDRQGESIWERQGTLRDRVNKYLKEKKEQKAAD